TWSAPSRPASSPPPPSPTAWPSRGCSTPSSARPRTRGAGTTYPSTEARPWKEPHDDPTDHPVHRPVGRPAVRGGGPAGIRLGLRRPRERLLGRPPGSLALGRR